MTAETCVIYIAANTMLRPTPPVQRGLKKTVEKLRQAGHEIVEWVPELHKDIMQTLGAFFLADGGKSVAKILEPVGEPWRPEMQDYAKASEIGVYDLWQLQVKRTQLMKEYLDRWTAAGIDCILCPTTPYASVEHGKFSWVGYTVSQPDAYLPRLEMSVDLGAGCL